MFQRIDVFQEMYDLAVSRNPQSALDQQTMSLKLNENHSGVLCSMLQVTPSEKISTDEWAEEEQVINQKVSKSMNSGVLEMISQPMVTQDIVSAAKNTEVPKESTVVPDPLEDNTINSCDVSGIKDVFHTPEEKHKIVGHQGGGDEVIRMKLSEVLQTDKDLISQINADAPFVGKPMFSDKTSRCTRQSTRV